MTKETVSEGVELDPEALKQNYVEVLKSLSPNKYRDLDTNLPMETLEEMVREEQRRDWEHLQTRSPI